MLNSYFILGLEFDCDHVVISDLNIADILHGVLHKSLFLIDIREPEEIKATGKIGKAINIPSMYSYQKSKFDIICHHPCNKSVLWAYYLDISVRRSLCGTNYILEQFKRNIFLNYAFFF